jgi:hypothetical protein
MTPSLRADGDEAMTSEQFKGRRQAKKLVSCCAAGLFLLRLIAIFLAMDGTMAFSRDALGARGSDISLDCQVNYQGAGKSSPSEKHRAGDCVLCVQCSHLAGFDHVISPTSAEYSPLRANASVTKRAAQVPAAMPLSWTSSWSSRAPPVLS